MSKKEALRLCADKPRHNCRLEPSRLKVLMGMAVAYETQGDRVNATKTYIKIGNLAITGCRTIRDYARESQKTSNSLILERELIGLRVIAQDLNGNRPVCYPSMGPMILKVLVKAIKAHFRDRKRDAAVRGCITLGKMYAVANPLLLAADTEITQEDVAEEIGLHIFLLNLLSKKFLPDAHSGPICGTQSCPLNFGLHPLHNGNPI